MKKAVLIPLIFGGLLCYVNLSKVPAQQAAVHSPVKLYSVVKYRGQNRHACLNLLTGTPEPKFSRCDVFYGFLELGDEKDWFQSSAAQGHRSVIKDLGELEWTSSFKVPVVAELPKLKPGEQRHIAIDASGADGADGASGRPGQQGADADGVKRRDNKSAGAPVVVPKTAPSPKHDGKPKVDPMFVKAMVGHLYVIHVVDDVHDFYALFRVEALERGDNCTVSWQLIAAPEADATQTK